MLVHQIPGEKDILRLRLPDGIIKPLVVPAEALAVQVAQLHDAAAVKPGRQGGKGH